MNAWEVVFAAGLVIGIGGIFWGIGYLIARECTARRTVEEVRISPLSIPHVPPPLRDRPPPGCAVVEHPCSSITLAQAV